MLFPSGLSDYSFSYYNWGTNPSATPGTSVIPGASNAEGAWTQIASSANIAQDVYWLAVQVFSGGTASSQKDHLLDIGVDPGGGTAYVAAISNIVCGESGGIGGALPLFVFPLFIKAGSSVAARVQGNNATAGTIFIIATFKGQPSRPEAVPVGMFSETIGTITNSAGPSFTPGNAADGTWVSLGTTTKAMWWWQLGYQISNATITAERTFIELAHGDGTNKQIIIRTMHAGQTQEQCNPILPGNANMASCLWHVPAGGELWVRGRCENAPDSGYNAVAIGIGG
jgi:hypothetical protein